MATDPVCGMIVEPGPDALALTRENRTYYFCSTGCRDRFAAPAEESRRLRWRLVVAWPLAIVVLVLTYAVGGREVAVASAVLAGVVQFYPGWPFYLGARDAIRHRSGNMDLLIAVGTTAAYVYSVAALLLPSVLPAAYYFDASAFIVTLILTGSYLEHLTRTRAGSAIQKLGELLPREAHVLREGVERPVPLSEVRAGDLLRVRPGGRFPADGVVREGRTSVEESLLTGESRPAPKAVGDAVLAGAVNLEGVVVVEATGVGQDSFLAQVGRLLNEAEMSRVPLRRTADRIASVFTPVVLVIAIAAGVGWVVWGGAPLTVGVLVFVTVAVAACPCAFGIATPAAILVGTGRAAEEGILFRGGDAIERAARADLVLTDKTGTLTDLTLEASGLRSSPGVSESELLATAAGLEAGSDHPLAPAVTRLAQQRSVLPLPVRNVVADPGRGLRGTSPKGPVAILRSEDGPGAPDVTGPLSAWVGERNALGETVSVVWSGNQALGAISFSNPVALGVPEALAELRFQGIRVVMVTGDQPSAAKALASRVGLTEIRARATPAEKVDAVREFQAQGHRVAFVGDGINDAAALAAADVGLAIGSGTEVAKEAGQVLLVRRDFRLVPEALGLARRTVARVRGNLFWAIGYNAVLIPVAAGALVPAWGFGVYDWLPMVGALAMGISSTTVVLNSLTLRHARAVSRPAPTLRVTSRSVPTG
jgi:P-type Cu+ transporter